MNYCTPLEKMAQIVSLVTTLLEPLVMQMILPYYVQVEVDYRICYQYVNLLVKNLELLE